MIIFSYRSRKCSYSVSVKCAPLCVDATQASTSQASTIQASTTQPEAPSTMTLPVTEEPAALDTSAKEESLTTDPTSRITKRESGVGEVKDPNDLLPDPGKDLDPHGDRQTTLNEQSVVTVPEPVAIVTTKITIPTESPEFGVKISSPVLVTSTEIGNSSGEIL